MFGFVSVGAYGYCGSGGGRNFRGETQLVVEERVVVELIEASRNLVYHVVTWALCDRSRCALPKGTSTMRRRGDDEGSE